MKYKVALLRTGEGFSVSVPGLSGCWSQGDSEAEALLNIHAFQKKARRGIATPRHEVDLIRRRYEAALAHHEIRGEGP